MKTLMLAALVALSLVLSGCVTTGDYVGTHADDMYLRNGGSNSWGG